MLVLGEIIKYDTIHMMEQIVSKIMKVTLWTSFKPNLKAKMNLNLDN